MIQNHPCATEAGVAAHIRYHDGPCRICKEWLAKVKAGEASKPAPIRSKRQVAQCATPAGYAKHRRNAEAACKPCREAYSAANRERKARKRAADGRMLKELKPCGTTASYQRHKRAGEEPCEPCKQAQRDKSAKDNARIRSARVLLPCGTTAAYDRHLRNGEEACAPCKEAQRVRSREKRANYVARQGGPRPHAGRKPINHGTTAGRAQHVRRGEKPCDPCKAAFNEYNRQYNINRKSRRVA